MAHGCRGAADQAGNPKRQRVGDSVEKRPIALALHSFARSVSRWIMMAASASSLNRFLSVLNDWVNVVLDGISYISYKCAGKLLSDVLPRFPKYVPCDALHSWHHFPPDTRFTGRTSLISWLPVTRPMFRKATAFPVTRQAGELWL